MVSFELGKEIEKDVLRLVKSVGHRKKFWVPERNPTSDRLYSTACYIRSVYVVTFLQFGKRSLPFPCNLSITATRDLSFRKLPPGACHLNLNFLRGLTRPDMVNKVFYFENRAQTLYFVEKNIISSQILWQLFLAIIISHERTQFLSDKQFFCSGCTELNSLDFFNLLVFL